MMRIYKLVGGPLDGSTVEFPWWMGVTKFYAQVDEMGEYVETYHACTIPPDDEPAYQWEKQEKT